MSGRLYQSHQLDIYGAWIHLTTTPEGWAALRRRGLDLPDLGGSLGMTSRDPGRDGNVNLAVYLDMARLGGNPAGLIEILAHEAFHVAGMLLDALDEEYDGQSEAMAYLVGWTSAWLWRTANGSTPDLKGGA